MQKNFSAFSVGSIRQTNVGMYHFVMSRSNIMGLLGRAMVLAVCISIALSASGGAEPSARKSKTDIVFLISEDPDNYEAHKTIPVFAETLKRTTGFNVTVLLGQGPRNAFHFNGLEAVRKADLVVVFCRRVALAPAQLGLIKEYLKSGKPLIGLRTANHAFSVREKVEAGHEAWWEFVPEILGCENKGYGPVEAGTDVSVNKLNADHPILAGVPVEWHSIGNLYLVKPLLDPNAVVLLNGMANGSEEPIAWTRQTADKSRIFYTSLGYPEDFNNTAFQRLFINAIYWALNKVPVRSNTRQK